MLQWDSTYSITSYSQIIRESYRNQNCEELGNLNHSNTEKHLTFITDIKISYLNVTYESLWNVTNRSIMEKRKRSVEVLYSVDIFIDPVMQMVEYCTKVMGLIFRERTHNGKMNAYHKFLWLHYMVNKFTFLFDRKKIQ